MDPFDELARLTASGASGGHTSQQRLSTNSHQQSSGDLAPASQFTPNMSALPVTARGNPFVDTPPKAKTAPARARAVPSGVFQVLPST